jgi:hypothetical protein
MFREDTVAASKTDCEKKLVEIWRADERALLSLAQRCLALYHARWRAGTLFTLSPEERAFFANKESPVQTSAEEYIRVTQQAVICWPPLRAPAEEQARLHGVYGALRAALEMDARDDLQLSGYTMMVLGKMLTDLREDSAAGGTLLQRLQTSCGLSVADVAALCTLATQSHIEGAAVAAKLAALRERAAADVARHGLRRCALPSCGATEPHPKCYKLCGRWRGVAYCSPAHCVEDWKRHKREEGCRAAASGS